MVGFGVRQIRLAVIRRGERLCQDLAIRRGENRKRYVQPAQVVNLGGLFSFTSSCYLHR